MPTYTYECKKCGHETDVFHAMSAKPRVACSTCGSRSTTKKLGTGAGIIFKGSGFYETDYKRDGNKSQKAESTESSKSESKSADSTSKSDSGSKSESSTSSGKSSGSSAKTSAA